MEIINFYVELFAAIIVVALMLGNIIEKRYSRDETKYFQYLLIADLVMLIADAHVEILADSMPAFSFGFNVLYTWAFYSILYYFACYFLTFLRQYVSVPGWIQKSAHILCGAFAVGWVALQFLQGFFSEKTRIFMYGACQLGSVYIFALVLVLLLRNRQNMSRRAYYGFLSFPLLPLISTLFLILWPGGCFMEVAITTAIVLVHSFVRISMILKLQQQELQLSLDRIHMATRQIQPHFLYNVLNSIYALCELDPSAAQEALAEFSEYLRVILDNIENDEEIPILQELSHVRHYLDLEKMRFRDALCVEYDLAATEFSVPPLSLQPFVENAVNHGLMARHEGGTLIIRTWEDGDSDCVEIRDDGVGFDPDTAETHVGIENAVHRLKAVADADVRIDSAPGAGTSVIIRVPRKAKTLGAGIVDRVMKERGKNT